MLRDRAILTLLTGAALAAALTMAGPRPAAANQACAEEFTPLRANVETRGRALQATIQGKRSREEVCAAAQRFQEAENRLIAYMRNNKDWCMIPDEALKNASAGQARTANLRRQACSAAPPGMAAGPRQIQPQGPGLVDAAGVPRLPGGDVSGPTFNTLTGNALTR